jgi:hypothetical protein
MSFVWYDAQLSPDWKLVLALLGTKQAPDETTTEARQSFFGAQEPKKA